MKRYYYKLLYKDAENNKFMLHVTAKNAVTAITWFRKTLGRDGYIFVACSTNYPRSIIKRIYLWFISVRIKGDV